MKTFQMRGLISQHPCAFNLVAILARDFPRERHVDCDRALLLLRFDGEDYSRDEVHSMLKACCNAGITIANEGSESTGAMTWSIMPVALLESLSNGEPIQIQDHSPLAPQEPAALQGSGNRMLMQRFLLRSDCLIRIALPHDLTHAEVNRITAFMESLVIEQAIDIDDLDLSDIETDIDGGEGGIALRELQDGVSQ